MSVTWIQTSVTWIQTLALKRNKSIKWILSVTFWLLFEKRIIYAWEIYFFQRNYVYKEKLLEVAVTICLCPITAHLPYVSSISASPWWRKETLRLKFPFFFPLIISWQYVCIFWPNRKFRPNHIFLVMLSDFPIFYFVMSHITLVTSFMLFSLPHQTRWAHRRLHSLHHLHTRGSFIFLVSLKFIDPHLQMVALVVSAQIFGDILVSPMENLIVQNLCSSRSWPFDGWNSLSHWSEGDPYALSIMWGRSFRTSFY